MKSKRSISQLVIKKTICMQVKYIEQVMHRHYTDKTDAENTLK